MHIFPRMAAACALATIAGAAMSDTVTVQTATGPAQVAQGPASVVAFDVAAIDTLTALGVSVAGMPAPNYLDYLQPVADGAKAVGSLFEPDFEALASMAPELIVAGGRSSTQVEALSRIAPTVDMTIWGGDLVEQAKARTIAYGKIFGKESLAGELAQALDTQVAEVRAAAQGKGSALILLTNGGKLSAYGAASRFGWMHQVLGLPEAREGLSEATHGEAISFEFIADVDPDWILVIDRGAAIGAEGEAAAATLDNPLVAGTKAARNGRIVYLSSGPLYIASGGLQSMSITLDELAAAFTGAEG